MTFKAISKEDYMGFTWYGAYENGKPVLVGGEQLAYHALDEGHANAIHKQFNP